MRYACALLTAGSLLLGSCSQIERGRVYNETAAPIVVRLRVETAGGPDRGDVLVTLKPGQGRTFQGFGLRHDQLPVISGGCVYVHALNGSEFWVLNRAGLVFPIKLAIKPDFSLDLQHEAADRAGFRRGREFGFPRRPISKTCARI